jgi:hypothetical protein
MKLQKRKSNEGGVLVVTIVICALVGLMLSAYLSMVASQHSFTQRSQVWNNTIPMCEAGIEEAMAHINHASTPSNNFGINGWIKDTATGHFKRERPLNGGVCQMDIDTGYPPIITVRGSLKEPIGNGNVTRVVKVRTKMNQRFPAAILAKGSVTLSGSGIIDSFNSTNTAESTGGLYDPAKATDRALVATTQRTTNCLTVGNMTVFGYAATGPGGTVRMQPSGNVGDRPYCNNAAYNGTIQPGHLFDDANYFIPTANLPSDFGAASFVNPAIVPPLPAIGGTNYKYAILTDGDYQMGSISVGIGEKMLVAAKARLYVSGSTTIANSGYILLGPGASIEWYARGPVNIGGGGCINAGGEAINFSIVSLLNAPVTYGGQASLIGTIYAPNSAVTLNGTTDCYGAITCNSFSLVGTMSIHFDEALKGNPKVRFLASSWEELKP